MARKQMPMAPIRNDFLKLFVQTGDCIWAVDASQRIVFWNQSAEESLGYTAEAALGQLCYQVLAGQGLDGKPFCKADCFVIEGMQPAKPMRGFDLLVRHHDGGAIRGNVSLILIPTASDNSALAAVVHLFRPLEEATVEPLHLRIYLLGSTAVWWHDGSQVDGQHWRRAKVRALLAYLAFQRGQAVHREILIEALWPDLNYLAALHNLNTTVYHLRLSLEPPLEHGNESSYIHYEGDCYSLNGGARHWLDIDAFETGIAQARQQSNSDQAIQLYRDALALYRGDLVADLGHAGMWCRGERVRLRELYLNVLQELGGLREQRQEYARASELYLKALAADPCRETACRRLMQLAIHRGDRPTAVAHYRVLAEALQRELEVTPSQETRILYEQALSCT